MKSIIALIFALVIAMATASGYYNDGYYGRYADGFRRTPYGIEARYNNAERQKRVNFLAEKVGASSGTARYYGVPGTGRYFPRHYAGGY